MPPDMKQVYSSQIESIGYDGETRELYVTFRSSQRTAVYEDVPDDVAADVMNAGSVGLALNNLVKPLFSFHYAN